MTLATSNNGQRTTNNGPQMRRAQKKSMANASAVAAGSAPAKQRTKAGQVAWPATLFGRNSSGHARLKDRDLVFILRNLSTLTSSGVSLPKALSTLAEEKALEKHREMLQTVRRRIENGEAFSSALAHLGDTFDTVMVNQIKV